MLCVLLNVHIGLGLLLVLVRKMPLLKLLPALLPARPINAIESGKGGGIHGVSPEKQML
jgi:hypothetical protein